MKTGFRLYPDRGTRQATVNARLASGFYDQPCILAVAAHDMTRRDGVWVAEPVVTPDEEPDFLANVKAAFNREDSASFHEPDHDHGAADDSPENRVIPAPGTANHPACDSDDELTEHDANGNA